MKQIQDALKQRKSEGYWCWNLNDWNEHSCFAAETIQHASEFKPTELLRDQASNSKFLSSNNIKLQHNLLYASMCLFMQLPLGTYYVQT